jgi:hypothetical protein
MPSLRGPLPLLPVVRAEMAYTDIVSVERRDEIYSSFRITTMQNVYSLVTRDLVRFSLGVVTENWDHQLPFDQAAQRIAARAGLQVRDRGAVRVGGVLRAMMNGVPPWSAPPVTPEERTVLRRRAKLTIQVMIALMVLGAALNSCFHR